jgi:opacity protein-like surface antigen
MKTLTAAALLFASLAAPAMAGGLGEAAAPPVVVAPEPARPSTDWSGAYVGLQVETITDGEINDPGLTFTLDGDLTGVFGGYRFDFGQAVLGVELDYVHGDGTISCCAGLVTAGIDIDRITRLGVEAGVDLGRALVYGTAGIAEIGYTAPGGSYSGDGHFYGLGVDVLVTDRIVVGVEMLRHEFGDFGPPAPAGSELEATTFGAGVAWRF